MKKLIGIITALLVGGLLVSQASAWWGSHMGYGPGTPAYQNTQEVTQYTSDVRSEIASLQQKLNQELSKDKPDMNQVRELNRKLAGKRQQFRSMSRSMAGRGYGGYHHGPHMMGGYGSCGSRTHNLP